MTTVTTGSPSFCAVLTATIEVRHPQYLRPHGRKSTALRLADYERSLTAWLTRQSSIERIVVVENSGHPMPSLRAIAARHARPGVQVELLSFVADDDGRRGRSAGELELIAHALRSSELVQRSTHVVKCTGRVFVPNVDRIIPTISASADLVATFASNLTWLDSVFFIAEKNALEQRLITRALEQVNDATGDIIERVLARAALVAIADGLRWYPFFREPRLEGRRAFDDTSYPASRLRALLVDVASLGLRRIRHEASHRRHRHPTDARGEDDAG